MIKPIGEFHPALISKAPSFIGEVIYEISISKFFGETKFTTKAEKTLGKAEDIEIVFMCDLDISKTLEYRYTVGEIVKNLGFTLDECCTEKVEEKFKELFMYFFILEGLDIVDDGEEVINTNGHGKKTEG